MKKVFTVLLTLVLVLSMGLVMGAPVSAEDALTTQSITLDEGWNLVSLPLIPAESSIDIMLADLIDAGTVRQVQAYNTDDEDFDQWASKGPMFETPTLTLMEDGSGYWIEMNTADVLVVSGYELSPPEPAVPPVYDLVVGWNLIGFTSITEKTAADYLGPAVMETFESMYKWENGIYVAVTSETFLNPGEGYWLAVNAEGTIYP